MDNNSVIGSEVDAEADESYVNAALEDGQTGKKSVQRNYATVLTEEDIRALMEIDVQSVSDFTSLSKAEATLLLSHLRWNVDCICKQWSAGAQSVRDSVGLLELDPPSDDNEYFCGACGESHPHKNLASVSCGHRICTRCWTSHINKIISEKPAAEWNLWLKCPVRVGLHASCPASVGLDTIERFASKREKFNYNQYLLRSYVDNRETMKWHPIQGSRCAIDLSPGSGNASVSCHRLVRFCWNCREDAHSPVDCKTAAKWLLENAVPCPKCKLRIPRNQDNSLKMKCLPCNYVFCWFCHVDWIEDMEGTGGDLHFCTFDAVLSDQRGKMSESDSNRYEDCYENWDSNELLMQKEQANLPKLDTIIQELSNTQLENVSQLKFILEAGLQIIECRRVLEWTYVYGYYLREDEVGKQNLLKDTQERLKKFVENLKHCLETNLQPFRYEEEPSKDFNAFRIKLTELTSLTRNHYENVVKDVENGLASVVSEGEASGSGRNQ
ncbi:RING/U-box superfamily protein [Arabidopsis thaliana]|uniref:Probable E3 ubiquitin-protein ligase ARI12 n=1 Tax=Arabidopsis thaliana TaxID=3702 RepID=ARI12_ARATH|nr:RING/U-box superfamily protein [Arabidopsis thaliana]Q84RQ9.2 RecName: Full=Probable E3 ubiquitin-protein ligase ARI12; AltName: Full=ARIADNE-like protein ARI12; AltName: Full=Protein ariadne homolog 12; AltName: Full=RING-type E3 ubiquitin transferase ARI12 [Arabidopsis thaliana]AEE27911.1 RING/U-box superfamily protein [Arabidopsis thaliana]|eukprot:NP_001184919.1 RING/U-box superfamily protein [Arabidopsis thaliana]